MIFNLATASLVARSTCLSHFYLQVKCKPSVFISVQESSSEIRDALRGLLCSCRITTSGGLNTTIHALLDNLKKYPTDRESIWK